MAWFRVCSAAGATAVLVLAGTVISSDGYEAPSGYYDSVQYTGTPDSLRNSLNSIIRGHTVRSYNAARQALAIIDRDPNNPSNIILMYSGTSVSGSWDAGATWNREHMWPRSLGVGDNGPDYSDLHALRPSNPSVNSSRGNKPFGLASSAFWDPTMSNSPIDFRGEAARAVFYMEVRYNGTESSTTDLRLVSGFPSGNQMGDLNYLLNWHYDEPPTTRERRRNHMVYSFADNPFYAQGNRNPFVDHPEYAWAIWGPQPNNSQITIAGAGIGADGGSQVVVDFGRFIRTEDVEDAPGQTIELVKTGSTPTSYLIEASGDAFSANHGIPGTFSRNTQSTLIDVALWSADPGPLSGQLVIDNTDLTSAGAGQGSADGDDIVFLSGQAVNPSAASLSFSSGQTDVQLNLGTLERGYQAQTLSVPVFNVGGASETTADLVLTRVVAVGDIGLISLADLPSAPIAGGASEPLDLLIELGGAIGSYQAVYTIETADEDIPGGEARETLTVAVSFELELSDCPADLDGDGLIGLDDLNIVLTNFGSTDNATLATGDASGDGSVDLDDLNIVLTAFGSTCP